MDAPGDGLADEAGDVALELMPLRAQIRRKPSAYVARFHDTLHHIVFRETGTNASKIFIKCQDFDKCVRRHNTEFELKAGQKSKELKKNSQSDVPPLRGWSPVADV